MKTAIIAAAAAAALLSACSSMPTGAAAPIAAAAVDQAAMADKRPITRRIVQPVWPAERLPGGVVRQVNGPRAWRHIARNVI